MRITGPQMGELKKAIIAAFEQPDFSTFLLERMDEDLGVITSANGFGRQALDVIKHYNKKERVPRLLSALIAEDSDSTAFSDLQFTWGLNPGIYNAEITKQVLNKTGLQAIVNSSPFFNVNSLINNITLNKRCVCRIKAPSAKDETKDQYGTGFLVAEDKILTNYHVMEAVITNAALSQRVVCKFDYETEADDKSVNPGTDVSINENKPILASSPPSEYDVTGTENLNIAWPANCLDYALISLKENIGSRPYGINADKSTSEKAAARGWIKKSEKPLKLYKDAHVIIIQHPDKQSMKIVLGPGAIQGTDAGKLRVRYNVNTMEGSSGSPCFDEQFNWIALHNSGDPNYYPTYNQGIPADKIIQDIKENGIDL